MSTSNHNSTAEENSKHINSLNSIAPTLARELNKLNEADFGLLKAIHLFLLWINSDGLHAGKFEVDLAALHEKYRQARVLREIHFYEYQIQNSATPPANSVKIPSPSPNVNIIRQDNQSEEYRVIKSRSPNGLVLTHTIYKSLFSATQRSSKEKKIKRINRCKEAGDIYRKI